ncbi:hypothetical protein [Paenibacillus sp. WC2504]
MKQASSKTTVFVDAFFNWIESGFASLRRDDGGVNHDEFRA